MRSGNTVAAVFIAVFVLAAEAGAVVLNSHAPSGNGTNSGGSSTGGTGNTRPPGDLTIVEKANGTGNGQNNGAGGTNRSFVNARTLPEPGTLALLATALAGIGCGARRKRSA